MPATRKDLVHDIGTNLELDVQYIDPNDLPIDLTNYTAHWKFQELYSGDVILDLSAAGSSDGWIKFNAAPSVTANWKYVKTGYTLDIHDTAGNIKRLCFGELSVRRGAWV